MNKIIIFIFTVSIYLINLVNSQSLSGTQLKAYQDLFLLVNGYNTTSSCGQVYNPYVYTQCSQDPVTNTYYLNYLQLQRNNSVPLSSATIDLTAFVNISNIYIYNGVNTDSIFSKLPTVENKTYTIYIGNMSTTIDPNVVLPKALNSIEMSNCGVTIPTGFFSSTMESINIYGSFGSYSLPSKIPTNNIKYLTLPINHLSTLTSDQSASFVGLEDVGFTIFNDETKTGYQSFNLPSFNFKNVTGITINFESYNNNALLKSANTQTSVSGVPQYQLWEFDQSLNIPSMKYLNIFGIGFKMPASNQIDLSSLQIGSEIDIKDADPFLNCTTKPCLKTSYKTHLVIQRMSTNLSFLDKSNLKSFQFSQSSNTGQSLPDDFNYDILTYLYLGSNDMVGTIPEGYCRLPLYQLNLNYNELTDVADCFKCYGGTYQPTSAYILQNPYPDFNKTTQPSDCTTFNISMDYNKVAKTDGTTVIYIYGVDFGWNVESGPNVQFVSQTHAAFDAPTMNVTIPNYQLQLAIPQGVGANLNYTFLFGINNRFSVSFDYTYEVPVITGYTLFTLNNGTQALIINGTGFDYNNGNPINVNGYDYLASSADPSFENNGIYYIPNAQDLAPNSKLTVYAVIGGQKSNTIEFTIFGKLSLTAPTAKLNSTGGSLTLSGDFSTATVGVTTVSINGVSCTVSSVSSTSITITYPSSTPGIYPIVVSVGGQLLSSEVEYIQSSTPTPTVSTTPVPTNSSSSVDDGSTSSTLSISITLFISCLILSTIF